MHLQMAERIRADGRLGDEPRRSISDYYPAFYLGSVAPDFQTVCDIPRSETHFYRLPPRADEKAYPALLARHPELARPPDLAPDQAVFVSAYLAHLMLDLRWYHEILIPYFVNSEGWASRRERFLVHNTLLTYLDKQAVDSLPDSAGELLRAAEPSQWLPFAEDGCLVHWRDLLVSQLERESPLQTIAVYADRLSMSQAEFSANLERVEWMEEHLFSKVPVGRVLEMLDAAVIESVDLVTSYLAGELV